VGTGQVDAATVFPPGTLGFEIGYWNHGDSVVGFFLQPAYAFFNGLELSGVIESCSFGNGREESYSLELKGVWRTFQAGRDLAIAWVVGSRNDGTRFTLGDTPGLLDVSYARDLDNSEEGCFTLGFAREV
jgi:hypothetical protein